MMSIQWTELCGIILSNLSETDLPKSGSGKVLKRVLREQFWAGAERSVG